MLRETIETDSILAKLPEDDRTGKYRKKFLKKSIQNRNLIRSVLHVNNKKKQYLSVLILYNIGTRSKKKETIESPPFGWPSSRTTIVSFIIVFRGLFVLSESEFFLSFLSLLNVNISLDSL